MIIRGTTPTLTFVIPFDTDLLDVAYVTMMQNDTLIVEKLLSDCEVDKRKLSVRLEQEDTLKLSTAHKVEIGLVAKTKGGERFETETPFLECVVDTSKDGVI